MWRRHDCSGSNRGFNQPEGESAEQEEPGCRRGGAERRIAGGGLRQFVIDEQRQRLQLREQIRALQRRLGITTLFVTHDQEEALSMADRVGVMKDGRFEQVAAPDLLYAQPATAFVAEFVGTMNRLPGRIVDGGMVKVLDTVVPVRSDPGDRDESDDRGDAPVGEVRRPGEARGADNRGVAWR